MKRLNRPSKLATKCTWTPEDDLLKTPTREIRYAERPNVQRRLTYVVACHEPNYYCNCAVHVGSLYLFDLGRENYRCVCRIGRSDFIERFPEHYSLESFMEIPTVRPINL